MIDLIEEKIKRTDYWDSRVKKLECNYFGDEVKMIFGDENNDIEFLFKGCYEVKMNHNIEYDKLCPSEELTFPQIPYFIQNIDVCQLVLHNKIYFEFQINIFPLNLYVLCKDFIINA